MVSSTAEVMNRGMQCLTAQLGEVEAEQFISLIIREKFDYTRWQRDYFDSLPDGEFARQASAYAKQHPFSGKAKRI